MIRTIYILIIIFTTNKTPNCLQQIDVSKNYNIMTITEYKTKVQEVFKDIPNYEGLYQVSDLGRVKSLDRKTNNQYGKGCIMKQSNRGNGYLSVCLVNNKKRTHNTHNLVALVFLNNKNGGYNIHVDHKNGNKKDNRVCNLQVLTAKEHSAKTARTTPKKKNLNIKTTSKYLGVSFNDERNKWVSQIIINKRRFFLGRFNTELEASEAYQNKLKQIE